MELKRRIELMVMLGDYMRADSSEWRLTKELAHRKNSWFIPEFIDLACLNIANEYLDANKLEAWMEQYRFENGRVSKTVGIVMAGNIPLVGFHDFLCTFLSGHSQKIKLSSRDDVLLPHLVQQLNRWDPSIPAVSFSEMLKGCDAYIATGSDNSSRYFQYYFSKYPHIIRKNRTSVAVLDGHEDSVDLDKLADDIHQYFGLGCRNVTKLFVPANYDFLPLLQSCKKYGYLIDHHKYKNNYDYQLAVMIINKQFYMTNGSLLLVENSSHFSPISQLNYEYHSNPEETGDELKKNEQVQCVVGRGFVPFGRAQVPQIADYPDGVDTLRFLTTL